MLESLCRVQSPDSVAKSNGEGQISSAVPIFDGKSRPAKELSSTVECCQPQQIRVRSDASRKIEELDLNPWRAMSSFPWTILTAVVARQSAFSASKVSIPKTTRQVFAHE